MNLFIDTSLDNLYFLIFNDKYEIVKKTNIENVARKTDIFYDELEKILGNNILVKDLNIYITLGPGSFMGSRIASLFAKTSAMFSNKDVFTISTYDLLKEQEIKKYNNCEYVNIKISKKTNFQIIFSKKGDFEKIVTIKNDNNWTKFDYNFFEKHLSFFIKKFKKVNKKEIYQLEPIYLTDPQIGEIK